MGFYWEMFESVAELVYAADTQTYALVYMNPAVREILGMAPGEDYRGKKCYAVLQNRTAPCEFCNNAQLREGEVCKWSHFNPLIKKKLELTDTLIVDDGRRCRLEFCREVRERAADESGDGPYPPGEVLANACLQTALAADDPDQIIDRVIAFAGSRFGCSRAYVFEIIQNARIRNTYEWCAPDVAPQKELLQNEPVELVEPWIAYFRQERAVVIEDVEEIRDSDPAIYSSLKPQDIHSLLCWPLRRDQGEVIGFVGLDNPPRRQFPAILSFLRGMERFVAHQLRHRDMIRMLEQLGYHDALTGALNRVAFGRDMGKAVEAACQGILYCDIMGVRSVNDRAGYLAGDALIRRCYALLRQVFETERIYRMGSNEFLAVCPGISRERLRERRRRLEQAAEREKIALAIGVAWGSAEEGGVSALYGSAEAMIHEQKRLYYSGMDPLTGTLRNRRLISVEVGEPEQGERQGGTVAASALQRYLSQHPGGMKLLMDTLSQAESPVFLFVGDLRTNLFHISENLCRTFGFEGTVVENLLGKWGARICREEDRELYRQDLERIRQIDGADHDLKYRVYDADGEPVWVHSRAVISYDEETGEPRYVAGVVARQDYSIDPVTSFRKTDGAVKKLEELQGRRRETLVLGVGLNHFSEINERLGRTAADALLRDIAREWEQRFGARIWLYRLDGVRFAAIVNPECTDVLDVLVAELKQVVIRNCAKHRASVKYPCSVCVFRYPTEELSVPEKLLDTLIMFIEAAKANAAAAFTYYSEAESGALKARAEYLLHLNEDVQNQFRDFRIVIQPIVSTASRQIIGGEVLLRWKHGGRDVPPDVFIPLLEKGGMINQVGRWVFEETVKQCRKILADHSGFHLSFNVSYLQLSDSGFVPFMERTIRKYGIGEAMARQDGIHLTMELTENHFDADPETLMRFVESCRKLGMLVALDDFGSGYSSLKLLMKYPANIVKLDRAIIREVSGAFNKRVFMKSLVYACHEFDRKVCVEGVETAKELEIVEETGGDMVQGFHFFRPMELEDFYRVLYQDRA